MPRCPVCDAHVDLAATPTIPFCSDRCRLIDLGRWLDESYGLPERPKPGPGDAGFDPADAEDDG
jgi:endogenous inhibitor of DNA gyrase (YacG/DUF329 family)